MTVEPEHICWLDLETTGLNEKSDEILEVACVLTDFDLNEVSRRQWVVRPRKASPWTMPEAVFEMHTQNGLITEARKGTDIERVDFEAVGWIRGACPDTQLAALAGSGVAHFDRGFIAQYMPDFNAHLTYWTLDIAVLRRVMTRLVGVEFERMPIAHRAMPDVEQSISETKRLIALLKGQPCS